MSQEVEIVKKYRFEAPNSLPAVPDGHKCRRMHGHSFRFELVLRGEVDPSTGWLIDFGDISKIVKPLIENHLDHYLLNEVEGLENPTSEQISIWLWNRIKPTLPLLREIVVHETCTARCVFRGP